MTTGATTQIVFDDATAKAVEAAYLTPDVVAQRARVLELLEPKCGEHVIDIGAGPGLLALDLARLVGPDGRLVALDAAPAMVAMAKARLHDFQQATSMQGDAVHLEFPDASFDGAVSTQVYEYVADMPRALAELCRVLKPGGRTVVLDTDWRSIVWHSSDNQRMERMLRCWDAHLNDPHLAAKLGPLLTRAGLTVRRVEVVPMLSPTWQPVSYAGAITRFIHDYVRNNGGRHGIDPDEIDGWFEDQQALIARGEFFFSVNRYAFFATR
jgi:arsenite methyltransferase